MIAKLGTRTQGRTRTGLTAVGLAVGAMMLVSGCTAADEPTAPEETAAQSPSPAAPTATPDPTATAQALAAEDATRLPMPVDEIQDWAARVVPAPGSDGHLATFSGWLSEHSSPRTKNTFTSSPPGRYTVTIACLGGGPLAVSLQQLDEQEVGAVEHPCDGGTQSLDIVTASEGVTALLENPLEAEPAVYAVSLRSTP